MYDIQCTSYSVQWPMEYGTLYNCTMYNVHWSLYIVDCTLYNAQRIWCHRYNVYASRKRGRIDTSKEFSFSRWHWFHFWPLTPRAEVTVQGHSRAPRSTRVDLVLSRSRSRHTPAKTRPLPGHARYTQAYIQAPASVIDRLPEAG